MYVKSTHTHTHALTHNCDLQNFIIIPPDLCSCTKEVRNLENKYLRLKVNIFKQLNQTEGNIDKISKVVNTLTRDIFLVLNQVKNLYFQVALEYYKMTVY